MQSRRQTSVALRRRRRQLLRHLPPLDPRSSFAGLPHRALQTMRQARMQVCTRPRSWPQVLPLGQSLWRATANGVNTSKRLRLIAPTLEFMDCLCLLWCVPDFLVHTRGFLALFSVTRRTAETLPLYEWVSRRCKARALPHLTDLRCLRDTHLESANVAWRRASQWRTIPSLRVRPHQWLSPSSCALPHVPICLVLSREAPQGSGLAFASGDVVDGSMQLTQPLSASLQSKAFAFSLTCYPHRHRSILRCTFPGHWGSGMDLSCSAGMTR
jgi:hypothetical protein